MAFQEGAYGEQAGSVGTEASAWAAGFAFFGSMMLMMLGGFHVIAGIAALFDDTFYLVRPGYALEVDVTTWGWIHTIGGALVIVAGIGLLSGSVIARIFTIVVAGLSVLWNFYSVPYYPVWSILMIALAIGVIWALTVHGRELEKIREN